MGTEVRLVLYAADRAAADSAAVWAFSQFSRLDSLFSDYRTDSEVAWLAESAGTGEAREVTPELWEVLASARHWSEVTGGAFDVTLGSLTRLWRSAMRRGTLPGAGQLARARAASGYEGMVLDSASRSVLLTRSGTSLDLGGIAKGYAAQRVLDGLRERGMSMTLVDAGGDLALGDPPPGEKGWRIEFPEGEVRRLANVAVATSGDRYQYLEVDGVRYSHILDPRTGLGIASSPTVVVVALDALTADVLASALTVMDGGAAEALAGSLEGLAVRVTHGTAGDRDWETPGFPTPRRRPAEETIR